MSSAAEPLTFDDLAAVLKGEQPLPLGGQLAYSLPLSQRQVKELVPLLQDHEGVRGLRLRGCRLDDVAAAELSRVLAFNAALRTLDLRDNDIGDAGALFFSNALRTFNHTLLALDLSGNPAQIEGPDTLQEIAMFIHRNNAQHAGTPPATSPTSHGRALMRLQEVPPDTPAGRTHLTLSDAEVERRFQDLERTQAASDERLAALAAAGEQMAEFRSNLDVASQQMAMVLEMLQADMAALKSEAEARRGDEAPAPSLFARMEQRCSELASELAVLRAAAEGGACKGDVALLMDAVQMLEGKLGKLEAGGASRAQQEQQADLRRQVALADEAATKAGAEAEAVAQGMKSVSSSIQALQGELAANTAAFSRAQKQAAGAAEAVGTLEQQLRTVQLSVDAMEQALDGADTGRQLAALQDRLVQLAAAVEEGLAQAGQRAEAAAAAQAALQEGQAEATARLAALEAGRLAARTEQLEGAVEKLEAAAAGFAPAAAVEQLQGVLAGALEEHRAGSAAALEAAVSRLSAAHAEHADAVAAQLAGLPPAYDEAELRERLAAAEGEARAAREAVTAIQNEGLEQLRRELRAQLAQLQEHAAAAAAAADNAHESASAQHAALESAAKQLRDATAARLAALESAAAALPPPYDDVALRADLAQLAARLADAQADTREALAGLAPAAALAGVEERAEARQAALADRLTSLASELAAGVEAAAATAAEGRTAAADVAARLQGALAAGLGGLEERVEALQAAQAAAAQAAQGEGAARAGQLQRAVQEAAEAVAGVERALTADVARLEGQLAAVRDGQAAAAELAAGDIRELRSACQQAAEAVEALRASTSEESSGLQQRLAAAEAEVRFVAARAAAVEAGAQEAVEEAALGVRAEQEEAAQAGLAAAERAAAQLRADLERRVAEVAEGAQVAAERAGESAAAVQALRAAGEEQKEAVSQRLAASERAAADARGALAARLAAAESRVEALTAGAAAGAASSAGGGDVAAPAAAVLELQERVRRLEQAGQDGSAAAAAELERLRADFGRHQSAVLGQCTELQEGMEALHAGEGRISAAEGRLAAAEDRLEGAEALLEGVATAAALREGLDAQRAELEQEVAGLRAASEAQRRQLDVVQAEAAAAAERLALLAPADALACVRRDTEEWKAAVERRLEGLAPAEAVAALRREAGQRDAAVAARLAGLAEAGAVQRLREEAQGWRAEVAEAVGALAPAATVEELRREVQARQAVLDEVLSGLASAHAVAQVEEGAARALARLRAEGAAAQGEAAERLGGVEASLKAAKLAAGVQGEQVAALEAAVALLAPMEAVEQLRDAVEAQQEAVARQLGDRLLPMLSGLSATSEQHTALLAELAEQAAAAERRQAAAAQQLAALQGAVAAAAAAAAQGVSAGGAAALCQEAVRPLEARLAAAADAEALAQLRAGLEGLQASLAAFQLEQSSLADTVGVMRGSALAVAAAVAERSLGGLPPAAPRAGLACAAAATPVPSLRLATLRAASTAGASELASFPLTERTLCQEGQESDGEEEGGAAASAADLASVHAKVAVGARHHLRLEGVVAQQAQRIHCLEAELLCLKQLLVGGSPLVAARPVAAAATPASGQRFFDAESELGDASPSTANHRAAASAGRRTTGGSKLAAASSADGGQEPVASLDGKLAAAEVRPAGAGFGDLTNTPLPPKRAARKPAVAPAAPPAANPAAV